MGRQQQSSRRLGRPMEWSLPRSFRGRRSLLPQAFACGIVLALSSLSAEELPLYRDPVRPIAERTEDLLVRMTLAEKIGQLTQGVVRPGGSEMTASIEAIRSGRVGSYILGLGLDDPTARNKLQEVAIKESRLGDSADLWFRHDPRTADCISYSPGGFMCMGSGVVPGIGRNRGAGEPRRWDRLGLWTSLRPCP
jgi:hypothetical protein